MKRSLMILPIVAMALALSGCTAMFNAASYGTSDLYRTNNRAEVAVQLRAEAEAERLEAEARQAQWEARIAEANAEAAEAEYYATINNQPNYLNVVADDYQSAYARRLYGFQSPTYNMPSSYYDMLSSSSIYYVTAYDPSYYNIMVSGNQVWVEPKYITSMFGSWGATNVTFGIYASPWNYGWSYHVDPFYYSMWGYPRYSWYDWNWNICYGSHWGLNLWWGWGGYYRPWRPYHHHHFGGHHFGGPHFWGHHYLGGGGGYWNRGGSYYGSRGNAPRDNFGVGPRTRSLVNRGSAHSTPYRSPNTGKVYGESSRGGGGVNFNTPAQGSAGRSQGIGRNNNTSRSRSYTSGTTQQRPSSGNVTRNNSSSRSNYSSGSTSRGSSSSFSSGSSGGSRGGGGFSGGSSGGGGSRGGGSRGR